MRKISWTGVAAVLAVAGIWIIVSLIVANRPAARIERRVEGILKQLTLEEKINLIAGDKFATVPVPRLNIPYFLLSDGPLGTRGNGPTTAYAACVELAASWDRDLAHRVGVALGRDARSRGVHFLLAPGMNLYRAPVNGRNFEYLGEDPFLAGTQASAYIDGVQSQGVSATAKHFAANDQEYNRHMLSSNVDERTLRELHLKPFEICVKNGVWSVMTSYNPLNGVHASENAWLIKTVLKGEWGFRGLVISDWGSTYSTLNCANAGLDLEMPRNVRFNSKDLMPLIESGQVSREVIDDKVRRLFRVACTLGWLDRAQKDTTIPRDDPQSAAVALDGARSGITLLKNEGGLLPLDPATVKTVAVLGLNADPAVISASGSAFADPFHKTSVVDGLKQAGVDVIRVPWVRAVPGDTTAAAAAKATLPVIPADFVAKVKAADAAVVCIGFNDQTGWSGGKHNPELEGEGIQRSYDLPPGQIELMQAVLKLNPRTVVVLNAGGSVATADWIDQVPAFIDAFYPGQDGGIALAEILFGKVNPSGKLPFSWEKRWEDCAAYGNYPTHQTPESNTYKEGVFLGYRWFDAKAIEPLFPFGYGLSYTTFAYADLKVEPRSDGDCVVKATVTNSGRRAGAEVVQLYVEPPQAPVPRPPRELKGYAKVLLQPGESKVVEISVKREDLAYWDPSKKDWVVSPGDYVFRVGASSRQLLLKATIKL